VAYRNLAAGVLPPESATLANPYREWIGAQIRADGFGYLAAGRPELAADFAWRDASISHVKNGIYGEMWVAAMLAWAYVLEDPRAVVLAGLNEVPLRSRLADAVRNIVQLHDRGWTAEAAVAEVHRRWDEKSSHHWCHTISNAEVVAMALLWGNGDFGRTICLAVDAAFDTDCNGATAGSVLGMMLGARRMPERWTSQLRDRLHTGVAGYYDVSISGIARDTAELAGKLRKG
ncbi:MAG TPA: ADP-ribosylglycohydrolase family protein, partial [Planctomycetota bacterium]|nr:ADP-ribosylglycohydrolase family protein [Planctomycetota bacterium]